MLGRGSLLSCLFGISIATRRRAREAARSLLRVGRGIVQIWCFVGLLICGLSFSSISVDHHSIAVTNCTVSCRLECNSDHQMVVATLQPD